MNHIPYINTIYFILRFSPVHHYAWLRIYVVIKVSIKGKIIRFLRQYKQVLVQ